MIMVSTGPASCPPDVCLLSNGHYNVLVTAAGSGYSAVDGTDVTRWREDATGDCGGQYCYLRDLEGGRVWSAGRQPIGAGADKYEAELRPDCAVIRRRDGEIESCYEIAVVPDANAEVRRLTLTNRGNRLRTLDVTSYSEVALNPRRADQAHPAFAKLFLETERVQEAALLCRRRPRARDQQPAWALHVLATAEQASGFELETDRARFLGRGRSARNPVALETKAPLSGTTGPVLDPIFSLRRMVRLLPGESTVLAFTTAIPRDRDEAMVLAVRFSALEAIDRAFGERDDQMIERRAPALDAAGDLGGEGPVALVVQAAACRGQCGRKVAAAGRNGAQDLVRREPRRRDHGAAVNRSPVVRRWPARNSRAFIGRLPSA